MTEPEAKKAAEATPGSAKPDARPAPAYEPPSLVERGTLRNLTATGSHVVPTIPEGV